MAGRSVKQTKLWPSGVSIHFDLKLTRPGLLTYMATRYNPNFRASPIEQVHDQEIVKTPGPLVTLSTTKGIGESFASQYLEIHGDRHQLFCRLFRTDPLLI